MPVKIMESLTISQFAVSSLIAVMLHQLPSAFRHSSRTILFCSSAVVPFSAKDIIHIVDRM